jgi:pyruvate/oxaloacetate carboxyltransferase
MKRCFLLALFFALPASCLAADDSFEIKPVADGVYAAIAKPTYRVNSNTVIILLGDCVLVVDANSTPSAARSLIEQIKKLTPKPVKYVVNTHFHWDHSQGNEAYLSAWPAGVEIISSEATRSNIEQLGIPRWKYEVVSMPREIEQLKSDLQKASSAEHKKAIQKKLVEAEAYFAELKDIQITFPTMTVDRRLILHRDSPHSRNPLAGPRAYGR